MSYPCHRKEQRTTKDREARAGGGLSGRLQAAGPRSYTCPSLGLAKRSSPSSHTGAQFPKANLGRRRLWPGATRGASGRVVPVGRPLALPSTFQSNLSIWDAGPGKKPETEFHPSTRRPGHSPALRQPLPPEQHNPMPSTHTQI